MANKKAPNWQLERRGIETIHPYEHNPRIIKGKPFEDLKKSIDSFGLAEPLIINTDGTIVGGHARYFYLKERGDEYVDCYVPDRTLTEKEVKELNVRLNKNVAGEWDFETLANYFDTADLQEWGFEAGDFGGTPLEAGEDAKLPDDEKKPYEQMTFTLHVTQKALVEEVLELIKDSGVESDSENENENGNALYTLCKKYKSLQ